MGPSAALSSTNVSPQIQNNVSIIQTTENTNIKTNKIHPCEYIVSHKKHANVGGENILETANNRGCECRVRRGAEENSVVQNGPH